LILSQEVSEVPELREALKSQGMAISPVKTRAPYLRSYGFGVEVVFDVGVGAGNPWLYRSFPHARFVLIDPQETCAAQVREKGVLDAFHFHAAALGAESGQALLKVPYSERRREASLATLKTRTEKRVKSFIRVDEVSVPVRTLDDIAVAYPGPCGLKLEAEGAELEALQGARETLQRCEFVIVEMSVKPRFENLGLPSSIVACLAEAGLQLRDVIHFGTGPGFGPGKKAQPKYLDVLFTRWSAN
jgi:FkbM family methyltransferase